MKNVNYERNFEAETEFNITGKALPADAMSILQEFGGTEKSDIRVSYDPENIDDPETSYSAKGAVHEFENKHEAANYLSSVLGRNTAQPVEKMEDPLFYEEADEDAGADYLTTAIPNPAQITLDGEIDAGVHAAGIGTGRGGFYHVSIEFDTYGVPIRNKDEAMNDGNLRMTSQGKFIDQEAENEFDEIRAVANDFEDFMDKLD